MQLTAAQIAALVLARPGDDGRYHLTQDSGVMRHTVQVLIRRGLVHVVSWEEHPRTSWAAVTARPNVDWEVTLTKVGLDHRQVWLRAMWQAADSAVRQSASDVFPDSRDVERVLTAAGV